MEEFAKICSVTFITFSFGRMSGCSEGLRPSETAKRLVFEALCSSKTGQPSGKSSACQMVEEAGKVEGKKTRLCEMQRVEGIERERSSRGSATLRWSMRDKEIFAG